MNAAAAARIEKWNYVLGGVMSLVGLVTLAMPDALGFFVGATLSAVNFSILRRLVGKILDGVASGKGGAGAAVLFLPKMLALLAGLAVVLLFCDANPIWVAIGFSIFFLSIGIETVRFLFSSQQGIQNG